MAARFGLSQDDIEKLCGVFERYPQIQQVVVYGSRAKGNYRPGSDIDLTIMGHLDWLTFNQLEIDLDDLLLPYQIDLSLHEHIDNAELKAHIERVGQVLYSSASGTK
ncbi:nucleotidyltransferase domain-containing protein [Halomonas sediminis]|uniref:Nucleotidyltransferase domain-containing protein n=1 Tax=Vreelandella zhuhanensis TaxID=2684210 RepID=A0A7X3H0X6_9GAMM|nr:nucleotidyltransferase domain-containing protein [Halomonas zhuhanensis]MWJ28511.1 nucleotidyltransferase domain-containing protein [Halomonas zhuhanensis]